MPEEKFVVAHRENAIRNGAFPLSEEEGVRHLDYLQDNLDGYFSGAEINVSVRVVNSEAYISIGSKSLSLNLKSELNGALRKINQDNPGLAIVGVG